MSEILLNNIEPGSRVKVIQILGKGAVRRRLLDLGMIPGVELEVVEKAPLGDPIKLKVKGYNLSLRKSESELIVVDALGDRP